MIPGFAALALGGMFLVPQGVAPQGEPAAAPSSGKYLPAHPPSALAAMLDLPSPEDRRRAADLLATRTGISLDQWVAAAQVMPLRKDVPHELDARTRVYHLPLWLMGRPLETEIVVRVPKDFATRSGPQPLLFVGHETNSNALAAIETWTPLADRYGWVLAGHTEAYEAYRTVGWAYEPDAQASVIESLRAVRRHYDIDERRIVIAGVGRGGHMAWDLALRHPDLFAGLIAANGSPRLGNIVKENNLRLLEPLVQVAVRTIDCGTRERMQVENQKRALDLLLGFGSKNLRSVTAPDLATAFKADNANWEAFFSAPRTVPATLVRVPELWETPRPWHFGRNHWLDITRVPLKLAWPWPTAAEQATWKRTSEQGRRDQFDAYVRDHSPRAEVRHTGPGTFTMKTRDIDAIRLLLTPDMVAADGSVVMDWDGHILRKTTSPSTKVFLRDFAERFDRTFLPVMEVVLP